MLLSGDLTIPRPTEAVSVMAALGIAVHDAQA
jgi:hypothetical protein